MFIILKLTIISLYLLILLSLYQISPYLTYTVVLYQLLNIFIKVDNKKDLEEMRLKEKKDKELTIVNNRLMEELVKNMDEFMVSQEPSKDKTNLQ